VTKKQLITAIAKSTNFTHKQVEDVFDALATQGKNSLLSEGAFVIPDLVKITVKSTPAREARMGRNPSTGQAIPIAAKPASRKLVAKPAKTLKDAVV
jgi:nucleoid DNA-binding protein